MTEHEHLSFADAIGRFYVSELGFAPVAGRTLGYLVVCDPPAQTINDLAETLLVSRSAIVQAVGFLEARGLVRRARTRGDRVDKVTAVIDVAAFEADLDATGYADQARLVREGLRLLPPDDNRGPRLGEVADFYEFIAVRLPQLKKEWRTRRASSPQSGRDL